MALNQKIDGIRAFWQFDNPWQLAFNRLFFPGEKIGIYRYKGLEIMVDRSLEEVAIINEVFASPAYTQFFPHLDLNGPLNVFDIGSNIGCFPLLINSQGFELKKLVCVEMNPKTFSRLKFNIERNLDSDLELVNGAVCGDNRQIEVALGEGSANDSIYGKGTGGKVRHVQGYTFNELFEHNFGGSPVDLCKMDIEGAEFEVFAKPGHELIKNCRNLLIEIHHNTSAGRSRDLVRGPLTDLGFTELHGENKNGDGHNLHLFTRQ
jgi:FkbM family methyltransferase